MPNDLVAAYAPPTKEEKWSSGWKTLAVLVSAVTVILLIALTLMFFYVRGIRTDLNKAQASVDKSTILNNQGRAGVCFLDATRVNNLSDLPAICHSKAVLKYYDPEKAQSISKERDADALKSVVCLLVPNTKTCTETGS